MSGKWLSNTLNQYSNHTGQVEWNFNKSIHHLDAIMQNLVYISHISREYRLIETTCIELMIFWIIPAYSITR